MTEPRTVHPRFRPRLTLQTLHRGDGLLGMAPHDALGPRGGQVTVAMIEWIYSDGASLFWATPAPTSVLGGRRATWTEAEDAQGVRVQWQRDHLAESDALDELFSAGFRPLPADCLQWRTPQLARQFGGHDSPLWTLRQEDDFADFWSDEVPRLQSMGWHVVVRPGFAHESVPVTAWRLVVQGLDGEVVAHEPLQFESATGPTVAPLSAPRREGSWLLSLGVEVEGETLDLAPIIADLLRRDKRWLSVRDISMMDDAAVIRLRVPGGRRIDAPAAPLKAIVRTMLDLLLDPRRQAGPISLSHWDAVRLRDLSEQLAHGGAGACRLDGHAGWMDLAATLQQAGQPAPVPVPQSLQISLRPYQQHGVAWLQYLCRHGLGGILADDMGLGKTAQALTHVLLEKESGRLDLPALVVVPTSLLSNWQSEALRMTPSLRVGIHHGADRGPLLDQLTSLDVVLISYPLVWRDMEVLAPHRFHLLILDEAQSVKNAASKTAAAIRRIQSRHRLCLTGTPLENHLGELWAQFDFLMPGYLGDLRSFQRLWREPIEKGGETLRAELLARRVRPFILRRKKADVATELPPKQEVIERLSLEAPQKALYESVRVAADRQVRRILQKSDFAGAQISVLDALLKLRQACCDPRLLKVSGTRRNVGSAKLAWLADTIPALVDEGRRLLVFSQFTAMLDLIAQTLTSQGVPHLILTGETPVPDRADRVQAFQSGAAPVFLISLKAGGVGLNLTAADTVIHVDPWWNPAVEQQATDRAHRIGQTQPVHVYKLVVAGSIEERMLALQARKALLAEGVLGQDGAFGPKFSQDDLDALLAPLPN